MNVIQKYNFYLLENDKISNFEVGDYVKIHGYVDEIWFDGEEGTVTQIPNGSRQKYLVTFPKRFNHYLHGASGRDDTKSSYYITKFNMEISDGEECKKIIDRRQMLSDRAKDIDPFSEELWDD